MDTTLGSRRLITDVAGAVTRRNDYLPFGETIQAGIGARTQVMGYPDGVTPDWLRQKYTGKERDEETGLDYFGARYDSVAQGRFTGPDLPLADQHQSDPQSWNLYSYVRNNPLKNTDPSGRACVYIGPEGGDLNDQKNYTTIGTEHGTCADAFSNDVLLSQGAQQVLKQVAQDTEGPVTLLGEGLVSFFLVFGPPTMREMPPEPVNGISQGRTPQDVRAGGRTVPEPRTSGKVGTSAAQEAKLRADIVDVQAQGATDVRVNQAQVNAQGQMVGLNRPDLQYTLNGQRYYVEYERSAAGRGFQHAQRIKANDPPAIVRVKIIP